MKKNFGILAVIPARGGSKTIPKKNIYPLLGKPLIAYTIEEALKSKLITKVIVSSDDNEIIRIAKDFKTEAPFKRPKKLATDAALAISVIKHAVLELEKLDKIKYDYVIMLQPTTPLRTAEDIDQALKKLIKTKSDSAIGVVDVGAIHPMRMKIIKNDKLLDLTKEPVENMPRQKLKPVYIRNGAIYAVKRDVLINQNSFKGKTCRPFIMPPERSVNIDDWLDLQLAEILLKKKKDAFLGKANSNFNKVEMTWKSWYGNKKLALSLPKKWKTTTVNIKEAPCVSQKDIECSILHPVGTKKISQLAKGKRKVCIAIDDLTRPTETYRILPYVLAELEKASVPKENIFILVSLGTHRPLTRDDLIKKVGLSVVETIKIYNHNCYQNCKYIGKTSYGTPLYINKFFLESDFRISIGTLTPHPYAGFTGGGKIILPGLAGIQTITLNHKPTNTCLAGRIGQIKGNTRRLEIEETAKKLHLDFIINTINNSKGKTAGIFSGEPLKTYKKAVDFALKIYQCKPPYNADIGIFNAFPKDGWLLMALNALNIWSTREKSREIVRPGGAIVIIIAAPEGCGEHGLTGKGMKLHIQRDKHGSFKDILKERKLIFFSPNLIYSDIADHYPPDVLLFNTWEGTLNELRKTFPEKSKVSIFPCGPLQMEKL